MDRPAWLPEHVWPFESTTLTLSAGRISCTIVGSGPTLLFCHAGMWSFLWRDIIRQLSRDYRCVTLDPPGSGLSERVPFDRRTLGTVRDTIGELTKALDLEELTLVMHDLGGPTALAAADAMPHRVAGLVAVNTFGWRPDGFLFRFMLSVFGSFWMRELDAATAWLPAASTTRFGVGRHLDGASRRAFRRGMDRDARRTMHLLFRSALESEHVYDQAASACRRLAMRPLLTVFGDMGDYLRFRRGWRARFVDIREVTIPWGLHFPMCDDPRATAAAIDLWHRRQVSPRTVPPRGPRPDTAYGPESSERLTEGSTRRDPP